MMNRSQEYTFEEIPEAIAAGEEAKKPEITASSGDSVGSASTGGTGKSPTTKRRTWKKPKDKPKRPLSAYNIFFQHERSRIVEGRTDVEDSAEEIVKSIERILSKGREKRRHRKTHGRISFGDLARAIADAWKVINPKDKAIFEHYAEIEMMRYRKEVKAWKDKKELEQEQTAMAKHSNFISSMGASFSSMGDNNTDHTTGSGSFLDGLPDESTGGGSSHEPGAALSSSWSNRRGGAMNENFNSSFASDTSGFSMELSMSQHEPSGGAAAMGSSTASASEMQSIIQRQQQILQEQLREANPQFMGTTMAGGGGGGQQPQFVGSGMQQQQQQHQQMSGQGLPMVPQLNPPFMVSSNNMMNNDASSMLSMQNSFSSLQSSSMHGPMGWNNNPGSSNNPTMQQPLNDTMGGGGNWNNNNNNSMAAMGHGSLNSIQLSDALLSSSSHHRPTTHFGGGPNTSMMNASGGTGIVSDYSSSAGGGASAYQASFSGHSRGGFSGGGGNNSFVGGVGTGDGLLPPTIAMSNANALQLQQQQQQLQQQQQQMMQFRRMGNQSDSNIRRLQQQQGGGFGDFDTSNQSFMGGNMDLDRRSFHR